MLKSVLVAAALVSVLALGAQTAQAATRCGGQYSSSNLFWHTAAPSVSQVMAQLPADKRRLSGNMLSLDYRPDAAGKIVNQTDFAKHWTAIFGTNTSTGYGRLDRGAWMPGANSSWGNSTQISRKNLSQCIVDGTTTAICLGIPSHSTI
ncbi:MAG TPA: hypothetical protein VHL31_06990, partial [Geminicoccus sp.]|uniref:hypothetical protein n=1 Tax=Geminicoccus sp. TaxID=2024832 RepID=UPI002E31CBE9